MGGVEMAIDFDNYKKRIPELKECFAILPRPFYIRISGGKEGLQMVLSPEHRQDDMKYRELYDDRERLKIDAIRRKYGFTSNMILKKKCIGNEVKVAGKWHKIKNNSDANEFLESLL
jgi:hypothetical protein